MKRLKKIYEILKIYDVKQEKIILNAMINIKNIESSIKNYLKNDILFFSIYKMEGKWKVKVDTITFISNIIFMIGKTSYSMIEGAMIKCEIVNITEYRGEVRCYGADDKTPFFYENTRDIRNDLIKMIYNWNVKIITTTATIKINEMSLFKNIKFNKGAKIFTYKDNEEYLITSQNVKLNSTDNSVIKFQQYY